MVSRQTKLRFRRMFRRRRRQAIELSSITEDNLDRYVLRRLMRLVRVKRFVLSWVGLLLVLCVGVVLQTRALSSFYTQDLPVAGGTFREGIVGTFTNANPIYAQTEVDVSAARLVFSGLFTHDTKGVLVPDLAEKYELDETETIYTVHLKDNLSWHDGSPLTAKDVEFTYKTIQNPEAKSYLEPSWRGVAVKAKNEKTVVFTLSNSLSGFPHSLTTGIIPEHLLKNTPPSELRSSSFNNQSPIGSGPFVFQAVEVDDAAERGATRVAFQVNSTYHQGAPQLEQFIIRTYVSEDNLVAAFKNSEVDAMVGLQDAPDDIDSLSNRTYPVPLAGEVMVFFKNSQTILKSPEVRRALVLGIDKKQVFAELKTPYLSVDEPLLSGHVGYDKKYAQKTNNKKEASRILDKAGWKKDDSTGIRTKNKQPLRFRLVSASSSEFATVTGNLQKQWRELGVEVEVALQPEEDLQATVTGHNYDALMYGILLGSDPDVYPFWHSTQGDVRSTTRLNFSEYKSVEADQALEAGRTRSNVRNRAVKYQPFLVAWQKDNPALALYQPQFLYITSDNLHGFEYGIAQNSSDRYINVNKWKIRSAAQRIE